jgi:hypothetical protein
MPDTFKGRFTMRRLLAVILLVGLPVAAIWGSPRLGNYVDTVTINNGDTAVGLSVAVGTTTPALVYTANRRHREILIQNVSTYTLYLGTSTSLSASSGPRAAVLSNTSFTTNATTSIYGLYEPSAGTGDTVIGWVEYDSGD